MSTSLVKTQVNRWFRCYFISFDVFLRWITPPYELVQEQRGTGVRKTGIEGDGGMRES